jgi:hypothetical protein
MLLAGRLIPQGNVAHLVGQIALLNNSIGTVIVPTSGSPSRMSTNTLIKINTPRQSGAQIVRLPVEA